MSKGVIIFQNGTTVYCSGVDDPGAWRGPNVNFARACSSPGEDSKKKHDELKEDVGCLCLCALVTITVVLLAAILAWWVSTGG